MKEVGQTIIGGKGNCFEACLASVLEVGIEDVPNLSGYEKNGTWMNKANEWLEPQGLRYMECTIPRNEMEDFFGQGGEYYHLIVGPTREDKTGDIHHAVVGRNGVQVFDPHPTPLTLLKEKTLRIGVFIKTFN